jgi:hypothetical protein
MVHYSLMSDDLVIQELAASNIPSAKKSAIRRWYESMGGGLAVKRHVTETAQAVRQGAESGLTGGALGLFEAEQGALDIRIQGHEVPVDGALALLGIGGSIVMANDPTGLSSDLRNIGSSALSVFSYRKIRDWRLKSKGYVPYKTKSLGHGESDIDMNDPIVQVAQSFQE